MPYSGLVLDGLQLGGPRTLHGVPDLSSHRCGGVSRGHDTSIGSQLTDMTSRDHGALSSAILNTDYTSSVCGNMTYVKRSCSKSTQE